MLTIVPFFVSDLASGQQILNIFKTFSKFSGLTLNEEKCEVGALGKLGGAQVTLGNLKCINLLNHFMKILGVVYT